MFNHLMAGVDFALQPKLHCRYALDLAVYLGSSLDLFTAFHPDRIKGRLRSTKNSSELHAHFQQRMHQLQPAPSLSTQKPNKLNSALRKKTVRQGPPEEELLYYAKNAEIDLMILGISGFSYPFKEEFGPVILQVTKESSCPVLLLPEDKHFTGYKKILFICEVSPTSPLLQEQITVSAFLFDADIHYMQVYSNGQGPKNNSGSNFNTAIQDILPGVRVHYTLCPYEQLASQIDAYLHTHEIDLLHFICPNRNFWPNLVLELKNNYPFSRNIPIMIRHLD